ncbi:zincin-like metallopeptidase domain-containing protein [Pandoraea apista]|uniref:zincin-like metallopeptidase domain-containing protein n=1 Tax=Pandoraea apista TaxID=93218 RepID=UPI00065DD278|nr:zincin-like metallopeptidase domain-containing protein [Pandoraea apista]ALS68386.2 hypothetical protein AT395_24890 [Pandoraea apista]
MTEPKKRPFHEQVAETLIAQLERGVAPWQRPWSPGEPSTFLPHNPTTGKRYRGINAMFLMAQGRSDTRWLTYKQATSVGAQVRRGERGTPIQYWKFSDEEVKRDAKGEIVRDQAGEPVKVQVKLERPRVFTAVVFNGEQIDGMPEMDRVTKVPSLGGDHEGDSPALQRAERVLKASGARIHHGGNGAFYRPSSDDIHMPDKSRFAEPAGYYATALHELGHWTGHESRLGRDLAHPFGSEGYAKEELRAEIASMILGDELGIGYDPGQHAAYVKSWIKVLRDDSMEIFRAAADAEKIQEYILGLEQKQEIAQDLTSGQEPVEEVSPKQGVQMMGIDPDKEEIVKAFDGDVNISEDALRKVAGAYQQFDAGQLADADFETVSKDSIGVALPAGWTGRLQVQGCVEVEDDGERFVRAAGEGDAPEFWGVYAQDSDGTHTWIADVASQDEAQMLADRVGKIPGFVREAQEAQAIASLSDGDVPTPDATPQREGLTYLDVPYKQKNEAKALGAKWDRGASSWYVPPGVDANAFSKWIPAAGAAEGAAQQPSQQPSRTPDQNHRVYLAVPYDDREEARAAGAKWDKRAGSWYVGSGADVSKLARWKPENVPLEQGPAKDPREEFSDFLRSMDADLSEYDPKIKGFHPLMDGKKHRVRATDDKPGSADRSIFYVGHLEGTRPAGFAMNNRTGAQAKWKAKGYSFDGAELAAVLAEAEQRRKEFEAERQAAYELTASKVSERIGKLTPITTATPYLEAKGALAREFVLKDSSGTTYVPAYDVDGKVWTMQSINPKGEKLFVSDSRKEGCFHALNGYASLAKAKAFVIGEGYATMDTVDRELAGLGVQSISAFDAGNLAPVAKALKAKFPDTPILFAGDDDRHVTMTVGKNPGREKALAAAEEVGGTVLFPIFPDAEAKYPEGIPPVTPESWREHKRRLDAEDGYVLMSGKTLDDVKTNLSTEQRRAIDGMKKFTDWNDLAMRSEAGRDGVRRQLRPVIERAVAERQQENNQGVKKARGIKM